MKSRNSVTKRTPKLTHCKWANSHFFAFSPISTRRRNASERGGSVPQ